MVHLLPNLASGRRPLPSSSSSSSPLTMSNRTVATILDMMHGNLVIMSLSGMTVEAIQFRLKACAATLHLTLWLVVTHGVLKALILGLPCQTPKTAAVVPRRGNKNSLNINLFNNLILLKCLRSILLFLQRWRKNLLPKRKGKKGARKLTLKSLRKKVLRRE